MVRVQGMQERPVVMLHKALPPIMVFLMSSAGAGWASPAQDASIKIEEGMTIDQVGLAIGFKPTSIEEHTCGDGDTTPVWFCRIQTYADGTHTLKLYFNKIDDKPTWAVRSWEIR